MQRELAEETIIETPYKSRCVGLINDDKTDVGKDHMGVVHVFHVEQPNVLAREDDISEAGFDTVANNMQDLAAFETWSQICLKALFA